MKRLLTLLFAFVITASLSMLAQEPSSNQGSTGDKKVDKAEKKEAKAAAKDKSMSLTGWVKEQDGKTVFINDKDKQAWNIENMDAVKGHEGHHVELKGSADASTNQIQVSSVKMLKGDKGSMKKDSSQPQ